MEKLSFGEPFIETRYLEGDMGFEVTGSAVLVNLDEEKAIVVEGGYSLPPLEAMVVHDASVDVPGRGLLVYGYDILKLDDLQTLDCMRRVWKSNYELTRLEKQRGVPFYKSPRVTIGNVTMNYCLVSEPGCPSGIHREHNMPVKELHVQIAGEAFVDLMRSSDPDSMYASLPLTAGLTHIPTWDAGGLYPWHRYRTKTRSIFLGVEIACS
jgi:hypothetical protein